MSIQSNDPQTQRHNASHAHGLTPQTQQEQGQKRPPQPEHSLKCSHALGYLVCGLYVLIGGTPASAVPGFLTPESFTLWVETHGLNGEAADLLADPDKDGASNLVEFALDGDPLAGKRSGKRRGAVDGGYFTHTFPVRENAVFEPAEEAPANLTALIDGIRYRISGSRDLLLFDQAVVETTVDSSGLPTLSAGWTYRSFRLEQAIDQMASGFLRLSLETAKADEMGYASVTPADRDSEAPGWWMARHEQKVIEVNTNDPQILLIGDSITHNWESALGSTVWAEYFGLYPTSNLGFSGDRTENVLWRLRNGELPATLSPDLVILLIGTNNTGYRMDPAVETATGVQAILDELQATLPAETNILLLGILPRGVSESESLEWQRNDEVNALIAECANDPQITYLDIGHVFENEDGSMRTELMYDQYVHPNTDGYAAWAEAMEDTVLSLTGPPDWGP